MFTAKGHSGLVPLGTASRRLALIGAAVGTLIVLASCGGGQSTVNQSSPTPSPSLSPRAQVIGYQAIVLKFVQMDTTVGDQLEACATDVCATGVFQQARAAVQEARDAIAKLGVPACFAEANIDFQATLDDYDASAAKAIKAIDTHNETLYEQALDQLDEAWQHLQDYGAHIDSFDLNNC